MWVKFDGKTCRVRLDGLDKSGTIPLNKWVHIVKCNGKLYIDGKIKKEAK